MQQVLLQLGFGKTPQAYVLRPGPSVVVLGLQSSVFKR